MNSKRKRLWRELQIKLRSQGETSAYKLSSRYNYSDEYRNLLKKDALRQRMNAMIDSGTLSVGEGYAIVDMLSSEDQGNWEVAKLIMDHKKQEAKERRLSKYKFK